VFLKLFLEFYKFTSKIKRLTFRIPTYEQVAFYQISSGAIIFPAEMLLDEADFSKMISETLILIQNSSIKEHKELQLIELAFDSKNFKVLDSKQCGKNAIFNCNLNTLYIGENSGLECISVKELKESRKFVSTTTIDIPNHKPVETIYDDSEFIYTVSV
jgi:hypothetical protein